MDGEKIVDDIADRVRELITDAQERAAEIVRNAEAEAAGIRESAEAEAAKRLDEVRAALNDLQGKLGGGAAPEGEVTPGPVTVPEPAPPDIPEPTPDPVPDPVPGPEPVPGPAPEPMPEPAPPTPGEGTNGELSSDKAAARLVAMKMALDGASREEIDAHLADNYDVGHREKLLDDVLARAKA